MKGKGKFFILLFVIAASSLMLLVSPQTTASPVILRDGWEYRVGNSPLDKNKVPIWGYDTGKEGWKSIYRPANVPDRGDAKTVWFRIKLPDIDYDDPAIHLAYIDQCFKVYFDGKEIYTFGNEKSLLSSFGAHIISLPHNCEGKYVYLRVYSRWERLGMYDYDNNLQFGSGTLIQRNIIHDDMLALVLSTIFAVIGFMALLTALTRISPVISISFGMFAILLGINTITGRKLGFLIADNGYTVSGIVMMMSFYYLPAFCNMFLCATMRPSKKNPFFWIYVSSCIFAVLVTIAAIIDVNNLIPVMIPFFVFITIDAAAALIYSLAAGVRGNAFARLILFAMCVLAICVGGDMIQNLGIVPMKVMLSPWGLLVLVLVLGYITGKKVYEMYHDLQENSIVLEKLNTELVEKNKALSKIDELKDEFLANTSHELRTPLNGIIGIVESLIDGVAGAVTPQQKANLSMVATSGRRLASLVDDILDFSKLKKHEIVLSRKPVDVKTVTDMVLILSKPLIGKKNLSFKNSIGEIPYADADENRLQQIIQNLIGNAVKFSQEGIIEVSAASEGGFITVSVKDRGIGIMPDKHETIFQSFEQGDGSVSREYGGTGLGLSICKKLVELHGGRIYLESEKDKGSTFYFTLPVSAETRNENAVQSSVLDIVSRLSEHPVSAQQSSTDLVPELKKDRTARTDRIMVVDDEEVNLQVLRNQLYLAGFEVIAVRSGNEVFTYINKSGVPDIILLDVMMPHMTGYEVCRKLRESYSMQELPVIMLTAKRSVADIITGLECGANDYLAKPFDRREMLARLENLIAMKDAVKTQNQLIVLRREMDIARRIQMAIVPNTIPSISNVDMGVQYLPMQAVGGDFYDFMLRDDSGIGIIVADVSGHGVPAALIASMVKIAFSMTKDAADNPALLIRMMNNMLLGKCERQFITVGYVYIDLISRKLRYGRAGHLPLMVHHRETGKVEFLQPKGTVMGRMKDTRVENMEIDIAHGDRICLYSDGITECHNPKGEMYGIERLEQHILDCSSMTAEKCSASIIREANSWRSADEHEDDITSIVADIVLC